MTALEVGDIVVLRSGGPHMTVEGIELSHDRVRCVWFSTESSGNWLARETGVFPNESLRKLHLT